MRWLPAVAVVEIALATAGLATAPRALAGGGWLGLAGVAVAQAGCVLIAWYVTTRRRPEAVRTGVIVGAVAGGLYAAEGLSEYLSPAVTGASVTIGYIIVGGLVASNIVAAAIATWRRRSFRDGLTAAVVNAVTEYLVWYPAVLAFYYLFRLADVATVTRVWRAEGLYDDYARSGMTDLPTFVIQDFWGAGFFHLIAGLVLAVVFGSATAAVVSRLRPTAASARPGAAPDPEADSGTPPSVPRPTGPGPAAPR